ncbi:MAG: DUF3298 and DUF4163 domain-containing protein [Muribaculaceae bacterium]|nr:DUF3298 and DUF4163 domain-containing protein [Muribaculaceae bacterium]
MKHHTLLNIALAVAAGAAIVAGGCAKEGAAAGKSDESGAEISVQKIESELISARKSYAGFNGLDSCTLTLAATIEWPEQFGSAEIAPLQSALKDAAFGTLTPKGIKEVVDSFITETDGYDLGISHSVDAVVPSERSYECSIDVRRGELTPKYVTYSIAEVTYLGGAHPMTYTKSMTYAFEQHEIVSIDNLFNADKMDVVFSAVNEAAAAQSGVAKGELTKAGFFEDALPVSPLVSIDNGAIVFHYNRYDVAPYSMGAVDVTVWPYSVESALSPFGKLLLGD